MTLAEQIGKFQAQFTLGTPASIEIEYAGDLGVTDTYPVTASILTGFLSPTVDSVNMVSAPSMLQAHGIECKETRTARTSHYKFEISLTVVTDKETHSVSGTLFHGKDPRICIVDGMRVDAKPEGYMLVLLNEDKPNIIGRVGSILGEREINIANLMLGRDGRGGRALTVLNIDEPVDNDTLECIRQAPHVNDARLVQL